MRQIVLSKKLSKIIRFFFCILVTVVVFLSLDYIDETFRIKTIIVNKKESKMDIFGINDFKNKSTLLTKKSAIIDSIKRKNPKIKDVDVDITYPSTLKINVQFGSDFINLKTNNGYFILDDKGKIVEKRKDANSNYPILTYFQKIDHSLFQPGDSIDYSDILLALYFVEKSQEIGLLVNTVDISSLYVIRLKIAGKTVLFSTEKERETQIYELNSILKRFRSNGSKYNTIDLRFDKPLLKISD